MNTLLINEQTRPFFETAARSQGLKGNFETTVKVGTENITVRGNVINDAIKIGTAFKP